LKVERKITAETAEGRGGSGGREARRGEGPQDPLATAAGGAPDKRKITAEVAETAKGGGKKRGNWEAFDGKSPPFAKGKCAKGGAPSSSCESGVRREAHPGIIAQKSRDGAEMAVPQGEEIGRRLMVGAHPQDRAGGTRKARMGDWRGWEVRLG
jgi:hypothetical protein